MDNWFDITWLSDEAKSLVSINDRFDNESDEVKLVRVQYWRIIQHHIQMRDEVGRSFSGRQINMAITFAEQACEKAIKAIYNTSK